METVPLVVGLQCVDSAKLKHVSRTNEFALVSRARCQSCQGKRSGHHVYTGKVSTGDVVAHLALGCGGHPPAPPSSASVCLGSAWIAPP